MADIDTDTHYDVGPVPDIDGHGPVTIIDNGTHDDVVLFLCLDCGFLAESVRKFYHEPCDQSRNNIGQTWREWLDENIQPLPDGD